MLGRLNGEKKISLANGTEQLNSHTSNNNGKVKSIHLCLQTYTVYPQSDHAVIKMKSKPRTGRFSRRLYTRFLNIHTHSHQFNPRLCMFI